MAEWETHDASATGSATDGWNNTGSGDNEWDGNNNVDTGNFGNDGNDGFGNGGGGEGANRDGSGDRACFNCGEIGHNKVDCPNPRVERVPEGPCRHCGEEGHWSRECKAPKKIDRSNLPDKTVEEAWALILEAVNEGELDDIKHAVQIYAKASPETTFLELEKAFREQDIKLYLICIERPLASSLTNMDLQGYTDKKYTVTYRLAWNPPRPRDREIWPKGIDENFERLADAGETVDRGKPKCHNCGEIGHISKSCPQEKREIETPTIKCFNCDGLGHRMRDCPTPRVDKFACKNCGQSGHKVADCTEPRSAAGVECRKCNEIGHFSRDCPQGGGGDVGICRNCGGEGHMAKDCTEERKWQCRNCDEWGHKSRECPKPLDVSRVKCSNCQEMGHFKRNCKNPTVDEDAHGGGFNNGGDLDNGAGSGNDGFAAFDDAAPVQADGSW